MLVGGDSRNIGCGGDQQLGAKKSANCAVCVAGVHPMDRCTWPETCGKTTVSSSATGQPYYLCTVTCCDSVNCTKPCTTRVMGKATTVKAPPVIDPVSSYNLNALSTSPRPNGQRFVLRDQTNCPVCFKPPPNGSARLVLVTNGNATDTREYHNYSSSASPDENCKGMVTRVDPSDNSNAQSSATPVSRPDLTRVDSTRVTAKVTSSPELSSSPPMLANSSFTDYTESYTPVCTSANSNTVHSSGAHFKFAMDRKPSPLDSEYSFYLTKMKRHGFFRRAVPALPIAVAVLFCMLNLVIPGSGTLLASLSIALGSQTEYGPGYGCRSFCICFLSALLQFSTAIFVFGWVWSIMWGIVFIKNSLRYGERRDINTMSLC